MATWDAVATVKAKAEQILAFVAHNLSMGADHIWLYVDDPLAVIPEPLRLHPQVTVTLCDDSYWRARGKRNERIEGRQTQNARDAYARTKSRWLTHIDVDEFILANRNVATILEAIQPDALVVQMEPYEAMHDPSLADDIFTANQFRGPLQSDCADLRPLVLGSYADLFPKGMLSHSAGKCFFRTGLRGLAPRLHGAMLHGERVPANGRHPDLRVLHFHAQDRESWRAMLPFRLTQGAYRFYPEMQAYLLAATPDEIDRFYLRTQTISPEAASLLLARGRLLTANLDLRRKVQDILESS